MSSPSKTDLIDRVDANDRVVGVVTRGEALRSGVGFRVSHVLLHDGQGRVVLQKIGNVGTRHPGKWGASVAAYLHRGESPLEGARRRLAEELGVAVPLTVAGRTQMTDFGAHKFIYVYVGEVEALPAIHDSEHVGQLRYWTVGEIERALREDMDAFTETFPHVLRAARHSVEPA